MKRYLVLFILIGFALLLYVIAQASADYAPVIRTNVRNEFLPEALEE